MRTFRLVVRSYAHFIRFAVPFYPLCKAKRKEQATLIACSFVKPATRIFKPALRSSGRFTISNFSYFNISLSVAKLPSLSRFGRSAVAPLKKQITKVICFSPKPAMSYFPRQRQTKKKISKNKYELFRLTPPLSSFAPLSHFTLQAALFSYLLNRTLCKMRSLPALAGDSQDYKTFLS